LIRLAVRCPPQLAERVLAELLVLAPGGVEEDEGDGYVEYAIYGAAGELPELGGIPAELDGAAIEVTSEEIPDDWADRWRDFHKPVEIAGRIVVAPSWEDEATSGRERIVVDPGQAFGTGAHATTRMCLELLVGLAEAGGAEGALADWGTGSGVLAIAAAKLGWAPVSGCDHERVALAAAADNAEANGVEIALERRNLRSEPAPAAPTATANLTAPVLLEVAARLDEAPERLVCSGLLHREAGGVTAAFAAHGLSERRRLAYGEWTALLLAR
jgi:ribosomal protein L11 methyltransferase